MSIDMEASAEDIKENLRAAVAEGAERIAQRSREQVPVQTGALKENCRVEAQDDMAEVLYDLPYAIEQHEDMEKSHRTGKVKYLEDAFEQEWGSILQRAADAIGRATE